MAAMLSMEAVTNLVISYFTVSGVVSTAFVAYKFLSTYFRFTRDYFWGPLLGLSANLKRAGSWAVVTGCTDGIGKAYAEQLAKKGLNVVLISRTQAKLDDLAKEIESNYQVQTRTIAVDFTRADIYDKIKNGLSGLEVGTLVNNVGMSYSFPEYYDQIGQDDKMIMNLLNCNCLSMMMMINIVLPGMLERSRGYVINIASQAAERPLPLLALYSATKVSMDYISKALQIEYGSKGITFQCVRPGVVATKMSSVRKSTMTTPSPNQFVRSALNTVGITNSTNGFWFHTIQTWIMALLPNSILFKTMSGVRKAGLRKQERKKAQE